jgi:UDP-N-acetylglucosamine diphosphorylase / glucose-1-phosphate thymidylyltransferase / UDP-N-acetylgalactosamine diphosphorylase / glucosamine-1-phosphate N-acetyltransferase / galactosamine-1-phosphate N-acetyltransferase
MSEFSLNCAVILAAGRGTRMGEMTREVPKPMLPVRGKPLLEHIAERLAAADIERFFIVVGYRHELIEDHFRDSRFAMEFRRQEPVNGTGSAALLAKDFVAGKPFLLSYGDILVEPDEYLRCVSVLEENRNCAAAVAVKRVDDPWQGAAVYETDGRISRIIEKPPKGSSTTRWNSAGFYTFRPVVFDYLGRIQPSARKEYELTSALDLMLAEGRELRISEVAGAWRDVGRPEDLEAVNTGESATISQKEGKH